MLIVLFVGLDIMEIMQMEIMQIRMRIKRVVMMVVYAMFWGKETKVVPLRFRLERKFRKTHDI